LDHSYFNFPKYGRFTLILGYELCPW